MKPTQTGIAVAVALVVVSVFFIFPGLSPFGGSAPVEESNVTLQTATTTTMAPEQDVTELTATDITVGTGAEATAGDTVTVQYVGALLDGTVFDASMKHGTEGFTFKLGGGQVIKGWDMGVAGMKEGGKRKLVIPADLAYGSQAVGGVIPANSTLVFEVELVKVAK